jgi:hypothetical protein
MEQMLSATGIAMARYNINKTEMKNVTKDQNYVGYAVVPVRGSFHISNLLSTIRLKLSDLRSYFMWMKNIHEIPVICDPIN